jgi:hypothetical protein
MNFKCQITGVLLIHPSGEVAYAGDLFERDDIYIVNCNENSAHTPPEDLGKIKWIQPVEGSEYWTRKGVWVFNTEDARHSISALEYMRK